MDLFTKISLIGVSVAVAFVAEVATNQHEQCELAMQALSPESIEVRFGIFHVDPGSGARFEDFQKSNMAYDFKRVKFSPQFWLLKEGDRIAVSGYRHLPHLRAWQISCRGIFANLPRSWCPVRWQSFNMSEKEPEAFDIAAVDRIPADQTPVGKTPST